MTTHPIPLLAFVCLPCLLLSNEQPAPNRPKPTVQTSPVTTSAAGRVSNTYGRIALSFQANRGQTDESVDFVARGPGYTLFLTPGEAVFRLKNAENSATLRMKVIGAEVSAKAEKLEELAGKVNYFIGSDPAQWREDIPTYGRVRYRNIYPGIDLVYYGNQRQLEYDFVIAPGADWRRIALAFDGAEKIEIEPATGDLLLQMGGEIVRQAKPIVYQEVGGERRLVDGEYALEEDGSLCFSLGEYDSAHSLIIDPVLEYSTYLGGSSGDTALAIAVDPDGAAYITGRTTSTDFPVLGGPQDPPGAETRDAFVTKINPQGTGFVYSAFFGGSDVEEGTGIAADSAGNAYITGQTSSADFPTVNSIASPRGVGDIFVTKINADGSALVYSSALGGSSNDDGRAIGVDVEGNVCVTGVTLSTDFPTLNPFQASNGGGFDVFVLRINAAGSALIYSTYLGTSGQDGGRGIAVDSAGNAHVTGETSSNTFPTSNAVQNTYGGLTDAFVTKISAAGALVYSTFLGGSQTDTGRDIEVDAEGNAYVTGNTVSANFPTVNPVQPAPGTSASDAFITKINATGTSLTYSTYLGGTDGDVGRGIAVDPAGNAYVTGNTLSRDFPFVNAFDSSGGGAATGSLAVNEAFVTKINAAGSAFAYSSYHGGEGNDFGYGIAVDSAGNAYIAGETSGGLPTVRPIQGTYGGGNSDGFVAKITVGGPSQLLNIATRMRVQTGENVLIGGFIITGNDPKKVIIRGIGPSLAQFFSGALTDPRLELFQGSTLLASNNDWKESQQTEIEASGIPPSNDLESAIVQTLSPGGYTAILRGSGDSTGIGVVEAYDLDLTANSKLGNIATRGFVDTDDNVMIGGLIVGPAGGESTRVVVRAIGPTLTNFGIAGALQDPTLELVTGNGAVLRANNNWKDSQQAEITDTGLNPSDDRESALVETVAPGNYTAIVRGVDNITGVGLVEVYNIQ